MRSEDLLDESVPERLARRFRLSRRRQVSGLVLALVVLPLLTLALDALGDELALDAQVLLYLLAVVVIAMVGGIVVGDRVGDRRPPSCSTTSSSSRCTRSRIGDPDQVVALVGLRRRRRPGQRRDRAGGPTCPHRRAGPRRGGDDVGARRRRPRGPGLAARGAPACSRGVRDGVGDPEGAPARKRRVDRRRALGLGAAGLRRPRFASTSRPGPHVRLVGRGPALFAEDQRVLEAFAAAARTAYEGSLLSGEAKEAGPLPPSTRNGPPCWRRSAMTCGPRSPASRQRSAACASRTSSGRTRSARSSSRRSRTRATASTRWSGTCSTRAASRRGPQRPARARGAGRGRGQRPIWPCPREPTESRSRSPRRFRRCSADRGLLQRVW